MSTRTTFFQRIMQFMSISIERAAHERTRRYLVGLDDRTLEDMGFSRELLEQGSKAWPWRVPGAPDGADRLQAYIRDFSPEAEPQAAVPSPRIEPAVRFTQPDLDAKKAA
jgi:uncharacterized protein YjiS (DUF1127 family)